MVLHNGWALSAARAHSLDVPVVRRECLGRCEQGPAMRIAPGGPFFTEIDEAALAVIITELERFIAAGHASDS